VTAPNERWSLDFMHDRLANSRQFRALTIGDDFTKECLALGIAHFLGSADVIRVFEAIALERVLPKTIRFDNGSEFTSDLRSVGCKIEGVAQYDPVALSKRVSRFLNWSGSTTCHAQRAPRAPICGCALSASTTLQPPRLRKARRKNLDSERGHRNSSERGINVRRRGFVLQTLYRASRRWARHPRRPCQKIAP